MSYIDKFRNVSGERRNKILFKDKDVLDHEYIPQTLDEVKHRDEEIDLFLEYLSDLKFNKVPYNLFMYGKYGTGKTLITKLASGVIDEICNNEFGINVTFIYVYCISKNTPTRALKDIIDKFPASKEFKDQYLSPINSEDVYLDNVIKLINNYDGIVVLLLDEIDRVKDNDFIDKLNRIKHSGGNKSICIVCITNDLRFKEKVAGRTRSAFFDNWINVKPYDYEQLYDILKQKTELAFHDGVVPDEVIQMCAIHAARENGDARQAVDLLRTTAEIANNDESNVLTLDHVEVAYYIAQEGPILDYVEKMVSLNKVVLAAIVCKNIIEFRSTVTTKEIYNLYEQMCDYLYLRKVSPKSVRVVLKELDNAGVLHRETVSRGRHGVANYITLEVSTKSLYETLDKDEIIHSIFNTWNLEKHLERWENNMKTDRWNRLSNY